MGSERRTNPHRLYRERDEALLAGVCAGLARYFGFNRRGVRLVVAVSALFFLPFVAVSYLVLAIVLPARPRETPMDQEKADFWRDVSVAPSDVFSNVRHRFRELDRRLQRIEAFVTSREFEFDRELHREARTGRSA